MKNRQLVVLLIIVLVIVAITLAVFGPALFKKEIGKAAVPVQVMKDSSVTAKGVVESEEEIELSSKVVGAIAEVKVDVGDSVSTGQILALLDGSKISAKMQATIAALNEAKERLKELEAGNRAEDLDVSRSKVKQAEAVYARARDDFERTERLYKKDAATIVDLDRAREKMSVAAEELNESRAGLQKSQVGARKEEVEQARAAAEKMNAELMYYRALLKEYTIQSPIDGVVTERHKDASETVDVGTPLLKLINPKRLRIKAELEETDVGKVREGQPVEVFSDAYKDKVFHGKVYKVFPSVKRKMQRTFDPMASFDINTQGIYIRNDDFAGLKDGMTVTVRFINK